MGVADQKQFTDAVAKAKAGFWGGTMHMLTDDWIAALHACSRLAMFDMLPALGAISGDDRRFLVTDVPRNPRSPLPSPITPSDDRKRVLGPGAFARLMFAIIVIEKREIEDFGIPVGEVNDGRQFLGCTRLDDDGVKQTINDALGQARATGNTTCCEAVERAWYPILVQKRREPGGSLIANLAAAAHYMLARYHVCQALASLRGMKIVIDGYDAEKRVSIASGDRDLKGIATTGNRPFPPDFAIRDWAYRGADDGEVDRLRCNSKASVSLLPKVAGHEY